MAPWGPRPLLKGYGDLVARSYCRNDIGGNSVGLWHFLIILWVCSCTPPPPLFHFAYALHLQVARQFADMHDTPVRMLAKGVIRSIVPWARARPFFAARLRRRLTEEELAGHVQSTDGSVSRADAVLLVRGWYAQATAAGGSPASWSSHLGLSSPTGVQHGGPGGPFQTSPERALAMSSGIVSGSGDLFLDQQAEDAAFLEWAESSAGRAHVASELKALRSRSASRIVSQVLGTAEGKEGLLRSLQSASKRDPGLAMQLRMMLNEAGAAAGSGSPGSGGRQ